MGKHKFQIKLNCLYLFNFEENIILEEVVFLFLHLHVSFMAFYL